jgi:hypothetical protein
MGSVATVLHLLMRARCGRVASMAAGFAGPDRARAKRLLNQAVDEALATPAIGNKTETLAAVAMTCAGMAPLASSNCSRKPNRLSAPFR